MPITARDLFNGKAKFRYGFKFPVRLNIGKRKFGGVINAVRVKLRFKRHASSEGYIAV